MRVLGPLLAVVLAVPALRAPPASESPELAIRAAYPAGPPLPRPLRFAISDHPPVLTISEIAGLPGGRVQVQDHVHRGYVLKEYSRLLVVPSDSSDRLSQ